MSVQRFRVNTPNVVHEIIEGEAVIVNLANGMYYSVDRAGADIWTLIETETPVSAIETRLAELYAGSLSDIQTGVQQFIAHLHQEHLIVPVAEATSATAPATATDVAPTTHKPTFEPPTLQRYSDMEDLLLLDPLHDVDEPHGWPNQA